MTRGYWFTAPIDFTIVSIFVPTGVSGAYQSAQILRLPAAPPSYPGVTNSYTNLLYNQNVNSTVPMACNVSILNGDVIMILGARSTTNVTSSCTNTNSYGAYTGTSYPSSVCGMPMNLTRAGFQAHICRGPGFDLWQEPVTNYYISRVELMYTCGILPVGLTGFMGMAANKAIELEWQTSTEVNFDHYEIERASKNNLSTPLAPEIINQQMTIQTSDGNVQTVPGSFMVNTDDWQKLNFETLGEVKGMGQANTEAHYQFKDASPLNGYNYYRLKRIDNDGSFEYSNVIEVFSGENTNKIEGIGPNPTAGDCKMQVFSTETQNAALSVFDLQGKMLAQDQYVLARGANTMEVDLADFASGTYLLQLKLAVGKTIAVRVVKQ